jgi:hypothetical protein
LTHFLELGSGGTHLFLQLADAVGVGSLCSDKGIPQAFKVAGHLQDKFMVSFNKRGRIVAGSDVSRGTIRARAFLRHAGGLRPVWGSKTPYGHVEAELVQGHGRRGSSAQLRREGGIIVSFATVYRFCLGFWM